LFALGLMAKPMLVTMPGVLLLLDFWPLERFRLPLKSQPLAEFRRLALEKAPFFLLSALSLWVTYLAQAQNDSVVTTEAFPFAARLAHVPVAYVWYVRQLFWPMNLSVFYMLHVTHPFGEVGAKLALLAAITAGAVFMARKQPWFLIGWLWFLGMLVPVLGLVQVGRQAYADRYSYLPYIGLFIILAWGIPAVLAKWRYRKPALVIGALLVSTACTTLTMTQVRLWKNAVTLFQHAIALDEDNAKAWNLLGLQYMNLGNVDQAIACLREATKRTIVYPQAWTNLGRILAIKGDFAAAQDAFQRALLSADDKTKIYNYLGDLFMGNGKYADAVASFQSSLELAPDQPESRVKLGQSLVLEHQPDQAAVEFQEALRQQPDNAEAELGLAMILGDRGQAAEAVTHFRRAVELEPDSAVALNNFAWLLATCSDPRVRNGAEAVCLAERACELTQYEQAIFIGTLAAAYAEAGRYDDAVNTTQKACDVALAHLQKEVASNNERLMKIYKSGRAFHEEAHPAP
jgi:Flp pilus assembly protein TadD